MEQIYDIKKLVNYNATGNHWLTLTKKEDSWTASKVAYCEVLGMIENDTYFLSVYTSDLEPLAYYRNELLARSSAEEMLSSTTVQRLVNYYKGLKEKVSLYDDNYKFLLYAPAVKKWLRFKHKDVIPAISNTGSYFYLRIVNSAGDIIDSTGDRDIENIQEFKDSEASFGELLHALYAGSPIGEGASSLFDF